MSSAVARAVARVRRAIALLAADPAAPVTVAELARRVGVSPRTLQADFRRVLGTTPLGYRLRLRLQAAREELLAARPGRVTVTEVAHRWGFPHSSDFAARYRAAFGESPSQTLRRFADPVALPGRAGRPPPWQRSYWRCPCSRQPHGSGRVTVVDCADTTQVRQLVGSRSTGRVRSGTEQSRPVEAVPPRDRVTADRGPP